MDVNGMYVREGREQLAVVRMVKRLPGHPLIPVLAEGFSLAKDD